MEILGIILSVMALAVSLYTLIKHDLKLKQQSALLNKYQIDKIESEKEQEKKAVIEANSYKASNGNRIIKIYNKGKTIAKNVNVTIPDTEGFFVIFNPCPIDIRPQSGIEITLALSMGSPDKINIEFEWQDAFNDKNIDSQVIQLL